MKKSDRHLGYAQHLKTIDIKEFSPLARTLNKATPYPPFPLPPLWTIHPSQHMGAISLKYFINSGVSNA
jgi:hypothetical protein